LVVLGNMQEELYGGALDYSNDLDT
jgi:hypothetical protein